VGITASLSAASPSLPSVLKQNSHHIIHEQPDPMKLRNVPRLLPMAAAATMSLLGLPPAIATDFSTAELDQDTVISVAIPSGTLIPYKLWLVRETQPGASCFAVNGSNPGIVDPLWQTNSGCSAGFSSNLFSIRVDDENLRSQYSLDIVEREGELLLVGRPLRGRSLVIGRTGGITPNDFLAIELEPGWRITQRAIGSDRLSHFYYTNDASLASLLERDSIAIGPNPTPDPLPEIDFPFPDIARNIYAKEITAAYNLGLVAGGADGNFAPTRPVTREEAVVIVAEALQTVGFTLSETVTTDPFPDVAADRWSAARINALKGLGIVTGDQNGRFRPSDTITRAELMSMLRRAAEQKVQLGTDGVRAPELTPTGEVFDFSDTAGHWNEATIAQMSAYCNVATPLNERGNAFRPDTSALRDYTTAATFRMIDCGATPLE
jgi:N-acetylmuramoyl-L-alanine amidase